MSEHGSYIYKYSCSILQEHLSTVNFSAASFSLAVVSTITRAR